MLDCVCIYLFDQLENERLDQRVPRERHRNKGCSETQQQCCARLPRLSPANAANIAGNSSAPDEQRPSRQQHQDGSAKKIGPPVGQKFEAAKYSTAGAQPGKG